MFHMHLTVEHYGVAAMRALDEKTAETENFHIK
jgi:hypothetical protein